MIDQDRRGCDRAIAGRVVALLAESEHQTSTLLIRVGSSKRASEVAQIYAELGIIPAVLLSSVANSRREEITDGLISGAIRAVIVVAMLGEGFDLPSLRLVAYHDKHKSLAPTVQLIGRLVRADDRFPQAPVLVTVDDKDAYPELRGAVRSLYEEDSDWAALLPGIIDEEILETIADRAFCKRLELSPPELSVDALRPLVRATLYEAQDQHYSPDLYSIREKKLLPGTLLKGANEVFYSSVLPGGNTIVFVTQRKESPKWHVHSGLDGSRFDLHLVTWRVPSNSGQSGLLMTNSDNGDVRAAILDWFEGLCSLRGADPDRLHHLFDSLSRVSVSNVGVRTTQAGGPGRSSYRTISGSRVDRGIRGTDTAQGAIGHAMAQVSRDGGGGGAYNVGIAVEKSKIWESRYVSLRQYETIISDYGNDYWSVDVVVDPFLPAVTRGMRLTAFPESPVMLSEVDPKSVSEGWSLRHGSMLSQIEFSAIVKERSNLAISALDPSSGRVVWNGIQNIDGTVVADGEEVLVQRGLGGEMGLSDHLELYPLTIFFRNSSTVRGAILYERPGLQKDISKLSSTRPDWNGVNIQKETDAAAFRARSGQSVQAFVVDHLRTVPSFHQHRWILHNDGSGEIADLLVLELDINGDVRMALWHLKPSGGSAPAARVTDIEVVVAQAIKSRRWYSDPDLWGLMLSRMDKGAGALLSVIEGDEDLLRRLLGMPTDGDPWTLGGERPVVLGSINIVQPGLSWSEFAQRLQKGDQSAIQIRDLLCAFDDAVGGYVETSVMCSV